VVGFTINCPESGDTVMTDLREIGPTYYFAPPRVFESLLTSVMIRMEDAGALKRRMFHYFLGWPNAVARRFWTTNRCALATGCYMDWARCWSMGPCATSSV